MQIISSVVYIVEIWVRRFIYILKLSVAADSYLLSKEFRWFKKADTRGALCHGKTPPCPDPEGGGGTGVRTPPEKSQKYRVS